jgi:hypothetical protein
MAQQSPTRNEAAARAIITRIEGNFHSQNKRSCRDCLRSKALPCRQVSDLMESETVSTYSTVSLLTSVAVLDEAHQILLSEYTTFPPLSNEDLTSDDPTSTVYTSLDCMSNIATILRFVQLLLLVVSNKHLTPLNDRSANKSDSTRNSMMTTSMAEQHVVPPEQIYRMVRALLQGVCTKVCEFVKKWKAAGHDNIDDDDDNNNNNDHDGRNTGPYDPMEVDATASLDAQPVFCFAFASLLRMNGFVRTRGELLAPLWRGICDLVGVVPMPEASPMIHRSWREGLPKSFLIDAMMALGGFLREGKGRLEVSALNLLVSGGVIHREQIKDQRQFDKGDKAVAFQGKLVRFMITRMGQVMKTYFTLYQNQSRDTEHELQDRKAVFEVWKTLLELRGMATVLQLLSSTAGSTKPIMSPTSSIGVSTLKVYFEVAAKTGQCIMTCLQSPGHSMYLSSSLETFLHTDLIEPSSTCTDDTKAARRFRLMGRALGKVSILQQVMESDPGTQETEIIETRLKVVENLLLASIPACFDACISSYATHCGDSMLDQVTLPTTVVQRSLQQMTQLLKKMPSTHHPQLHRLFIRWLTGDCHVNVVQHPLARDLVIVLLHVHLVECAELSDHGGYVTSILSYLVKLLFDVRTARVLRSNISALLMRLQSSRELQESTRILIEQEFMSWMESTSPLKKRKRARKIFTEIIKNPTDFSTISWALKGYGMSTRFATEPIHERVCEAIQQLHGHCSNTPVEEQGQHLLASAERHGLLLAWLERWVLTSRDGGDDCIASFRQAFGISLTDFLHAVIGAISRLGLEADTTKSTSYRKKIILSNAAMRLSATFGRLVSNFHDLNIPFEGISNLISLALQPRKGRKDVSITWYNAGVAFEAISLLGSLGALVPASSPDRLLEVSAFLNGNNCTKKQPNR